MSSVTVRNSGLEFGAGGPVVVLAAWSSENGSHIRTSVVDVSGSQLCVASVRLAGVTCGWIIPSGSSLALSPVGSGVAVTGMSVSVALRYSASVGLAGSVRGLRSVVAVAGMSVSMALRYSVSVGSAEVVRGLSAPSSSESPKSSLSDLGERQISNGDIIFTVSIQMN